MDEAVYNEYKGVSSVELWEPHQLEEESWKQ